MENSVSLRLDTSQALPWRSALDSDTEIESPLFSLFGRNLHLCCKDTRSAPYRPRSPIILSLFFLGFYGRQVSLSCFFKWFATFKLCTATHSLFQNKWLFIIGCVTSFWSNLWHTAFFLFFFNGDKATLHVGITLSKMCGKYCIISRAEMTTRKEIPPEANKQTLPARREIWHPTCRSLHCLFTGEPLVLILSLYI